MVVKFPEWCFLCVRMAYDNSCGHFPCPMPTETKESNDGSH